MVACDLDEVAVESMKKNIEINGEAAKKVIPTHEDARLHMLRHDYVSPARPLVATAAMATVARVHILFLVIATFIAGPEFA